MSTDQPDKNSKTDELLAAIDIGDDDSMSELVALNHPELERHADFQLAGERPDLTLNTTTIDHEAFVTCRRHGAGCD